MSQTDSIAYVPILFWFVTLFLILYWFMFVYLLYIVVIMSRTRFFAFYWRLAGLSIWLARLSRNIFVVLFAINYKSFVVGGKRFFFTVWLKLYRPIVKNYKRYVNVGQLNIIQCKSFIQTKYRLFIK